MEITKYKVKIEEDLKKFFKEVRLPIKDKDTIESLRSIEEFTMRPAKRLRPIIMAAAYKCFKDDDKILRPSLSIELMQTFLLVHDDVMDEDELRRGAPTVHKIYSNKKDKQYGISMAICIGDLSCELMFDPIISSDFDDKKKLKAIKELLDIYRKEICGQIMDINNIESPSLEKVGNIHLLKTVPYTTDGPIKMGCAFAGGDISKFGHYGYLVGMAFQIKDDLLGIFGDTKKTGKSNASDILEGKMTYPIAYTLQKCSKEEKKFILDRLGEKGISEEDLNKVKEIIRKVALDDMNNLISNNIMKAKGGLNPSLREEGVKILKEIADFVGNRDF